MVSIYKLMEREWDVYCLMSGIALVEEMNKPTPYVDIKNNKEYICYHSIFFRVNNKDIISKWLKITRIWENRLNQKFITSYYKEPRKEKGNKKWGINFLPNWLYHITKTIGRFPSEHVNSMVIERLVNWRLSRSFKGSSKILSEEKINSLLRSKHNLYDKLLENKKLAAGAFTISFDLEFRGLTTGRPDLCMSETYKDFLEFMLEVANRWDWATNNELYFVDQTYNRNLGIKARDQWRFSIKSRSIIDIYELSGPIIDKHKDKCIKFHIRRMKNYVNIGGSKRSELKNTKMKILGKLEEGKPLNSTNLQFYVNVAPDVVLGHLNNLYKEGLINKERKGKYYLWSFKNASKSRTRVPEG